MAAYGTTSIIFTPLFGQLSDRKGRKLFLCTGLLCYSALSLGYIWADNVFSLIMVRLLQGAAGGMTIPVALAYIGDISPQGEEGRWMGYAQGAFFSGFGIGPLMGGLLSEHFGMNLTFFAMGGLNLVAFLAAISFLPEVKAGHLKRRTDSRLSFKEMSKNSVVRGLFSIRLAHAIARGAFITFFPLFAAIHIGLGLTLIGTLLAVNIVLMSILGVIGGRIADRFNRKGLVVVGNLLFLLSMLFIPLAGNFWHLFMLAILQASGGALFMPAVSALAVGEGRRFGMGSTMAMLTMGMNIGMALGPVVSGGVVDFAGLNSAFYFAATIGLIGTSFFIWFTRRH